MTVSVILTFIFIFESPRYLVAHRMYHDARYILSKIALINKRPHFNYKFDNELDLNKEV